MPNIERRHPENAQLRKKIADIQEASRNLQVLIDLVQEKTVTSARAGQVVDLPSVALGTNLSDVFKEQRVAFSQIQQDIAGAPISSKLSPLITDAELAALMR